MTSINPRIFGGLKEGDKHAFDNYVKFILQEDYYFICIKKCIANYSSPLNPSEKVCLAKCLDRSCDYLYLVERQINPFQAAFAKKYVFKLDGVFFSA